MPTSLIIGSGPAAAGAALALLDDPAQRVTVLDVGSRLEPDLEATRERLATSPESTWSRDDIAVISRTGKAESGVLPQKRTYGSDFPFRDSGQLAGVRAVGDANAAVVSGAYGGFSNVWGAQIMPFSAATFARWPFGFADIEPHYRAVLAEVPLAGEDDDLSILFPLLRPRSPLPPVSDRTRRILDRYGARRAQVQSHGITLGLARLALHADRCTRIGLCMTGCPYGLIYSAAHTFDRLRRDDRLTYRGGVKAFRLAQGHDSAEVHIRDLASGTVERLTADRVFVACGGLGTTRLVLGSLEHYDRPVELQESVQFVMPAVSMRPTLDPRSEPRFTLNQFNLLYDVSGDGRDLCQIHFYPYNELFFDSLPAPLKARAARGLTTALLRRLSVGLGYVPSWGSPRVTALARRGPVDDLPQLTIGSTDRSGWPPMLKDLAKAMLRVAPALDLWPVLPRTTVSAAAKSYHFGGSFPHRDTREALRTDLLGRLPHWDNIHLVDAAVFPDVPATTFTLTVMANAHRIATGAARLAA